MDGKDFLSEKRLRPSGLIKIVCPIMMARNILGPFGDKLNAWLGAVHGTLAISPMYATVSPFFMDGTEQTYTTTPDTGETTSASLLPK